MRCFGKFWLWKGRGLGVLSDFDFMVLRIEECFNDKKRANKDEGKDQERGGTVPTEKESEGD